MCGLVRVSGELNCLAGALLNRLDWLDGDKIGMAGVVMWGTERIVVVGQGMAGDEGLVSLCYCTDGRGTESQVWRGFE